jgi:hypothetical protein
MRTPVLLAVAAALTMATPPLASAQVTTGAPLPVITPPPPASLADQQHNYAAAELDRIVSPIALYPDPLLAQVLAAAAYSQQIPQAQQWVDGHRGMTGPQLTDALAAERVAFDPSVQALVAFPTVLQMMSNAMPWTAEIGDAFKTQRGDVMDAVQRMRGQAQRYGYLQSNDQLRVTQSPAIEIVPVNPEYVVVPYYDPLIVFYAPRPYYRVSTAIYFGYGVRLGGWYDPWGWRSTGFYWTSHRIVASYPGWSRPWNYRAPPPIYHYPVPILRAGSRGTATPRGYVETPRVAHDAAVPQRRMSQAEVPHATPTPFTSTRDARPRPVADAPRVQQQGQREAPRSAGSGGGRTAHASEGKRGGR